MTWLTLGEALEAALASRLNEVGDGDGCNRPDARKLPKGTGADEGPGQVVVREVSQEAEPRNQNNSASRVPTDTTLPMGRRMTVATASPKAVGCPTRAAVIRLVIDNGGGPARTQGGVRPGRLRASTGGGSREREFLKLVVGGSGH